jgi:hypothetical protein
MKLKTINNQKEEKYLLLKICPWLHLVFLVEKIKRKSILKEYKLTNIDLKKEFYCK